MTSTDAHAHAGTRRTRPPRVEGPLTPGRIEIPAQPRSRSEPADAGTGTGVPVAVSRPGNRWHDGYRRRLVFGDVVAVGVAVTAAQGIRFGLDRSPLVSESPLTYTAVSAVLVGLWLTLLWVYRTRDRRVVGEGTEEYRRVADATLRLFGLVAIVALVFRLDVARGYLVIAFPLGLMLLLVERKLMRNRLVARRRSGGHCARVVVVGSVRAAHNLERSLNRDSAGGYRVVAVCVPGLSTPPGAVDASSGVPVWGDETTVAAALSECSADTVAVTATDRLGHERMRELAWELQALDVDLVVAPEVVDVAGPRLTMRPVAGLPLLHVEEPQFEGAGRLGKLALDMSVAALALVLAAPLLAVAAAAIKLTSAGPVLYRSERIGFRGEPFGMLKLRTMADGADAKVVDLGATDEGAGPLFKMRRDPRITPVGRILRRFSIDELPQFLNVLRRQMSVVGPRPPLRREVATYSGEVRRRLLVKPGITGLWQVSGRSDLCWEESVRLDLYYVENWSTVQDLQIMWRTLYAMLRGSGAY